MDPFSQQEEMIWQMFMPMTSFEYVSFLYENPVLVEPSDQTRIRKNIIAEARWGLATIGLGITVNVLFKYVPVRFLDWPLAFRLVTRAGLLASPLAISFKPMRKNKEELENIMLKYFDRLDMFRKTKRLKYLDPQMKMFPRPK
jgi:hypothetical protein